MSSPLHSLKKNKIPLLPGGHMSGQRPIPFRHPEYTEDESRLLEEVTNYMVHSKRKQDPFVGLPQLSPTNPINLAAGGRNDVVGGSADGYTDPPSDHDLMRMMMNKIAFLEQQVTTQKEEIRVKDRCIKVLEDKLKIVGKSQGHGSEVKGTADLEKHCLLLQQQVHEMETFLAEYGMVWVGEENNDNSDVYINASVQVDDDDNDITDDDDDNDIENNNSGKNKGENANKLPKIAATNPMGTWRQENSFIAESTTPMNIDFDLLVENIRDLNVLAGEGVAQIKKTSDGARFQIPDPVQLTLYANGILMFNGPFRPYSDPSTKQCVHDLLDGYFPSELQQRFPDGVPFQLTDLRGVTYQTKSTPRVFAGEGQTLGGEVKPSRLIPSKYQDPVKWSSDGNHTSTTSQHPGKTLTQSQFLEKLPKAVIKDGKVIDVRSSISNTLKGKSDDDKQQRPVSNITLLSTGVTKEMSESVANVSSIDDTSSDRPKSYTGHRDVTTLRVVTENGDHTYIVKMKFKETIGNLRSYLDKHRRPKVPYDIVSTFPHKVHKNNNITLKDSGLTPNAVLHLKPST